MQALLDPGIQATIAVLALGAAAGALNAVAGGGPIIVVAALVALGWQADIASLTSTVALLPGQVLAGWQGRAGLAGCGPPRVRRWLVAIALLGGGAGAVLLLLMPGRLFAHLLPWLILFATGLYAWSSLGGGRVRSAAADMSDSKLGLFVPLGIYGGFYGGGNSFLVLALLSYAGMPARIAAHAKNVLIVLINAAAAIVFLASGEVARSLAIPLGAGAMGGSLAGALLLDRLDARAIRWVVIGCGITLGIGVMARM